MILKISKAMICKGRIQDKTPLDKTPLGQNPTGQNPTGHNPTHINENKDKTPLNWNFYFRHVQAVTSYSYTVI